MGFLLAYSLKSAILLSLLYGIYSLFTRSNATASLRRTTLLTIYCLAIFLPLLNFDLNHAASEVSLPKMTDDIVSPAITQTTNVGINHYLILAEILLAGTAVLLIRMVASFIYIGFLSLKGKHMKDGDVTVTVLKGKHFSPFCFGKRIFISEVEIKTLSEMVICHEKSHISRKHFLDLILSRLVTALQWWNPIAWLMQRELKDVHEYQADKDVIAAGFSPRDYQYMLLERTTGLSFLTPGHGLRNSRLRNRLKMMNRRNSNGTNAYRLLVLIPAALLGILIISSPIISPFILSASKVKLPALVADSARNDLEWESTVAFPPDSTSGNPAIMLDGEFITREQLNELNPYLIGSISVIKNNPQYPDGIIKIKLKKVGETTKTDSIPYSQGASSNQGKNVRKTEEPTVTDLDELTVVAYGNFTH